MWSFKRKLIGGCVTLGVLLAAYFIIRLHVQMPVPIYIGICAILLVCIGLNIMWLWSNIFRPIFSLASYLRSGMKMGDIFVPPYLDRDDEIGDMARTYYQLLQDSKEIKQRNQQQLEKLNQAREKSDQANSAKSEFLANMSHELRTPLNGILGVTQLMKSRLRDDDNKEMLDIIDMSSQNLLKIVNDILDLSKIEAKEVELESQPFNVQETIEKSVDMLRRVASKKSITLSCNVGHLDDEVYVLGDSLRFSRILLNLVNNAINYTEDGAVVVTANQRVIDDKHMMIAIEVRDTGIGIPESRIDKIFDKFVQADNTTTRRFGGTGLGLSISQELVQLMQGEIGVKSILGVGSTFWFEIPFEITEDRPKEAATVTVQRLSNQVHNAAKVPAQKVRLLLAEDHYMNVLFMKKLLAQTGLHNFKIVSTGLEAVEAIEEEDFDLILMDCHMPVMSGYEATTSIRAMPDDQKSHVPIIAMTANVMKADIDRCFDIGMNAHIGKPFDHMMFKEVLSHWIDFDQPQQFDEDNFNEGDEIGSPVDLTILKNTAMGDDEFLKEMVGLFIKQGQDQLQHLAKHCVDGHSQEWIEVSHSLKGTAACVGAEAMRLLCRDAQNLAEGSVQQRQSFVAQIRNEYILAKKYLEDNQMAA